MKNDLDELLKRVLTPKEEAGDILNRKILEHIKETGNMRQKKYRRASAAVIAAAFTVVFSITAVAAWQYKSAADIADKLGDDELVKNFREQYGAADESTENSGNMSIVGESQSYGGYKVTVLGILSGEELSEFKRMSNGVVRSDRTYCAVAIEREDGAAVDAEREEFFVSPLIGGLNPSFYNAMSLFGNYSEFVEDGILYRLLECDNIEYFADHELYLCVTDTWFYDNRLYNYNEDNGSISRNTEYQGLNALFDLEIDSALADPVKAQALIDEIDSPSEVDDLEIEFPEDVNDAMEWAGQLTPETIAQYCVRMENTVQTMTVDEEGYYTIQPWLVNEAVSDSRGGGGGKGNVSFLFDNDDTPRMLIQGFTCSDGMEDLVITTLTLNEDGTITFAAWVPKEVSRYLP